jgi:hypothetical protein
LLPGAQDGRIQESLLTNFNGSDKHDDVRTSSAAPELPGYGRPPERRITNIVQNNAAHSHLKATSKRFSTLAPERFQHTAGRTLLGKIQHPTEVQSSLLKYI